MIKKLELLNKNSCFNKAEVEEPIFILRSKDKLAPLVVEIWAKLAEFNNCPQQKVLDAFNLADDMKKYAEENFFGGKLPN